MSGSTCIRDKAVITGYLNEIADWKAPVQVTIGDRISIGNCRLLYGAGNNGSLHIRARTGYYPDAAEANVTCIHLKALYSFHSRIVSRKETDADHVLFEILFPMQDIFLIHDAPGILRK